MAARRKLDIEGEEDEEITRREEAAKKKKGYRWESQDRSWDRIQEDESGRIKAGTQQDEKQLRRRREALIPGIKRGIVRYSVLAIDASVSMNDSDMKPSRGIAVLAMCEEFVREFFDQNPMAHMAIIASSFGKASIVSPIGSSPHALSSELSKMAEKTSFRGDVSLQNMLELAKKILDPVPPYGSREVITIFSSLSTTDPGDIFATVSGLHESGIRCSIVGLAAEVYILRQVAKQTQGEYAVATNEDHLMDLLGAHVPPRALSEKHSQASLVEMGFPKLKVVDTAKPFFNVKDDVKESTRSGRVGYECPRCMSWLSDVPIECVLCGLTLITSPHLARSYHHLFPVKPFGEITVEKERKPAESCFGCRKRLLPDELSSRCGDCGKDFCFDCDVFIHDALHNCPGCSVYGEGSKDVQQTN